jgi:hypothetical protein
MLVALNYGPALFAGTRLAVFAEQLDLRLRISHLREDLDAVLAGYYEALVRKSSTMTVRRDFLQQAYVPHTVSTKRPTQRITNSFGMFDREYSKQKQPGTRRIALIGDSISVGEFGENFESLIEERLNREHRTPAIDQFEVLNLAVEGYRITQLVDVAWRRAPMFQPDVYLVTLTRLSMGRRWSYHVGNVMKAGVDLQYDFLRKVVAEAGVHPTDSQSRIERKLAPFHTPVILWSLRQLQQAAAHNHAKLVVLLLPWTVANPVSDAENNASFERCRQELEAAKVPVIDLRDSFAGEPDLRVLRVSRDDYHPNAHGHRLMADALYRKMFAEPDLSATILGYVPARQ